MYYTALYWLALHVAHGRAFGLTSVVVAQFVPVLIFSRRAGLIVSRHRAVQVVIVTQSVQALGSLALALPLLGGWMAIWYLWAITFAVGFAQTADVSARQVFMRDLSWSGCPALAVPGHTRGG